MSQEIERKFLVKGSFPVEGVASEYIAQGYIASTEKGTFRVRIKGEKGFITLKGHAKGISRTEYEYEIPKEEAIQLLREFSLTPIVEKTRYYIPQGKHLWEVDSFLGANKGLIVAEIELQSEDEPFDKPIWIGEEVSQNPRYRNSMLAQCPFSTWEKDNY
ncbi:MAG TPA: adenylate cyclase [Porphyromonadaceae bacterium]|nr:adenylate cyclase [Porphyromonadaceae bacterium]